MREDAAVRRLVEMLSAYYTEGKAVKEDLTCLLTGEFLANMQDVLFTKQIVVLQRWGIFLDICFERMLRSPEMYLKYVFYACLYDARENLHIFERFLGAFAFILLTCVETLSESGVNFCKLVPDVFMVFYEKELKEPFRRRKGFHRFIEFINNSKYLESECVVRDVANLYDPKEFYYEIPGIYLEKATRMVRGTKGLPEGFSFMVAEIDPESSSLAKKVLKITKTEFIPLLNVYDLTVSQTDLVNQKVAQISKIKREEIIEKERNSVLTSEHCPSLNLDPKTKDDTPELMAVNSRCEKVIEAAIRYNHSKRSCYLKSTDRSLTEGGEILEHLKYKIESFIKILDKYDKE